MMKTLRFCFYIVCLAASLAGAVFGLKVVGGHLIDRLDGTYTFYPDEFFRGAVILLLSLSLLVLLHIAERVVHAFDLPAQKRGVGERSNEPIVCLSCRASIPADSITCPKCGWSYVQAKSS